MKFTLSRNEMLRENGYGRVFLSLAMALCLAGCDGALYDFWGTKREEATNLLLRVENGDWLAYTKLSTLAGEASKKGDPLAAAQLGYVHHRGLGGHPVDLVVAKLSYDKARGVVREADYNAGLIELKAGNFEAAVERFAIAAGGQKRDGMTRAMVQMAMIYEAGKAGAPMSASLAAEWYEYASDRGDLFAKTKFAMILLLGKGRGKDIPRGLNLLEQAALFGNREARVAMSAIYATPKIAGVDPNRELAGRWLVVAAEGSEQLTRMANDYVAALSPAEQHAVSSAVKLFQAGHRTIVEPDDYQSPLRIEKGNS
jgi:TPR repeat protein